MALLLITSNLRVYTRRLQKEAWESKKSFAELLGHYQHYGEDILYFGFGRYQVIWLALGVLEFQMPVKILLHR